MNDFQAVWWEQARSDREVFVIFRSQGLAECHSLHYLQMATEKLAKAYFWRDRVTPRKSHALFVRFLRVLGTIPNERSRIADLFGFNRFEDLQNWIHLSSLPLAYELERLAPDLANDGPNPEYPWPHLQPATSPVRHKFAVWQKLKNTAQGRKLIGFIQTAMERFAEYADV